MIYQTKIEEIGDEVDAFLGDGMFILFGKGAPDELKDYCFIIEIVACTGVIEAGQRLHLGDESFLITAVGEVARMNLDSLGHITVVFNGATTAAMHGSVYVEARKPPKVSVGSIIAIEA